MITRNVEDGHGLADAVKIAEGLGPILICWALSQVAPAHEKLHLGMVCPSLHEQAVGNATDGVLHIPHKHEGKTITLLRISIEGMPRRTLTSSDHAITITAIGLQLAQSGHIISRLAVAGLKDFTISIDACRVTITGQFQPGCLQYRVALPADIT